MSREVRRVVAVAAVALPMLAAIVLALWSDGVYMDDDLTHYLMARWSWAFPMYLADDWGRPGFTVPYALVANVGSPAVGFTLSRLFTVAIAGVAAWMTWRIAMELVGRRWAWVAPAALLTMPLYFRLSYTTLTETICSLYAIAGTYWLLKDRTRLAAVAFSLVPLTRHEGILLLPVVALLLAWRRDRVAIPLLLTGELAWNLGKPLLGYPLNELPILRFMTKGDPGHLGSGGPLHYVAAATHAFGPAQTTLAGVGVAILLIGVWRRLDGKRFTYDAAAVAGLVCAAGAAGMLVLQTLLYMVNTHESGGYARFLLPAAPWTAVCVASAVGWLAAADKHRRFQTAMAATAIAATALLAIWGLRWNNWSVWWGLAPVVLPIAAVLLLRPDAAGLRLFFVTTALLAIGTWAGSLRPFRLLPHQRLIGQVMMAVKAEEPGALVVGDNPWTHFFSNRPVHPYDTWAPNDWRRAEEGGLIYLWDRDHSSVNLPLSELHRWPHRRQPLPDVPMLQDRPADDPLRDYLLVVERLPGEANTRP